MGAIAAAQVAHTSACVVVDDVAAWPYKTKRCKQCFTYTHHHVPRSSLTKPNLSTSQHGIHILTMNSTHMAVLAGCACPQVGGSV
jgi:hypothetical protein